MSAVFKGDSSDTIFFHKNLYVSSNETVNVEKLSTTLHDYLPVTGGKLYGNVALDAGVGLVFNDNSVQSTGFSADRATNIDELLYDTQDINYVDGVTEINNFKVNVGIQLPADALTMSNIDSLQTTITTINNNLYTNTTDINTLVDDVLDINDVKIPGITSDITTINTNITEMNTSITQNTNDITTHTSNITTINNNLTSKQNSINTINDTIGTIQTDLTTKQTTINNHSTNLNTINNKILNMTNVDDLLTITGSVSLDELQCNSLIVNNSLEVDGTFRISNVNYEITDQQFSYLKTLDCNVQTNINGINDNLDNINSNLSSKTTQINTILDDITTLQNYDVSNSTNMATVQSSLTTHSGAISSLSTSVTSHTSNLNSLNTTVANHTTQIENKQELINSGNKLNVNLVADGSVSNNEFQTLQGILTTQTIQHQIDTLTSSFSTLNGLQDLDIVSIGNITTDLSVLNTFKTNQLTLNNSLDTSITNLSNNKQDTINSSNKVLIANVNLGSSSLSNVDISSSLTDLLNNKQNTLSNASNLANVDITGSLTDLLNNKQNTLSNASNLANVDI